LRYVAGLYQVGETKLYVNRGFGTVGVPSRVGAPPEVTRLVLVAA
jgi:predicted MPP superfamily phosphohydrolase